MANEPQTSSPPSGEGREAFLWAFCNRPAPLWLVVAIAGLILLAPALLMWDWLEYYALTGDDFLYIADGRDWGRLIHNLFEPHNTHIVPLFRLWTFGLVEAADGMARWPFVFAIGAYVPVLLAMLEVGYLVARERSSAALGLIAMVLTGVTTTIEPAYCWYSAGQALWSGVFVLLGLIAARSWREGGGTGRLVGAFGAVTAAPLWWSGGLVAGPAVAAFLAIAPGRRNRRVVLWFLVPTLLTTALIVLGSLRPLAGTAIIHEVHSELWPRPIQAIFHMGQAVTENLLAGNLGFSIDSTPAQAFVVTLALLLFWTRSWWGRGGPKPLGLAGVGIVVLAYCQVYYFRGNLPFASHLRLVRWYHAVPQLGAVLLLMGWGPRETENISSRGTATYAGLLGVLGVLGAMLVLHLPQHRNRIIEAAPKVTDFEYEKLFFRTPELQYYRARYFAELHAARQRKLLARLGAAEAAAAREGLGRDALGAAFGMVYVPGMPNASEGYNGINLLRLAKVGRRFDTENVRRRFSTYFELEPEPRPPWLQTYPQCPWPPPDDHSMWIDPPRDRP